MANDRLEEIRLRALSSRSREDINALADAVRKQGAVGQWEYADRGSLAIVLDKVREAGFTAGLHAARDVDRLGYVVVRQCEPGMFPYSEYTLADASLWDDRDLAEEAATDHRDLDDYRYLVAEVHQLEEETP